MLQVTAEREVVTLGYGTLLEPRGWLNAVVLVADPLKGTERSVYKALCPKIV